MIDWTEQKIQFALRLAAEGVSRAKIAKAMAAQFGDVMTTSMITGKLNRSKDKGYVPVASPIRPRRPDDYVKPEKPKMARKPKLADIKPRVKQPLVEVVAVRRMPGCQWPIGNPGTKDFHFCDKPVARSSDAYCADCRKRAYIKPRWQTDAADGRTRLSANGD